jgi:hypothetical protein
MHTVLRKLTGTLGVVLALAAVAAVAVPAADAQRVQPLRSSLTMSLDIYDQYLTGACGFEVSADVDFTERRTVFPGADSASPASELATYDGTITWNARERAKTYTSPLKVALTIAYPQGIDLFKPARVTVVGSNGGTFPIGGGPPGLGVLVYNATIYSVDQGFPYWFVEGDPISKLGLFDFTTHRICSALS